MKPYVTVGLSVLAGVALFEVALVPGILIGGAAVLAPRYLPKGYLPKLRRRLQPLSERTVHRRAATAAASLPERPGIGAAQNPLPKFAIGRAVAKIPRSPAGDYSSAYRAPTRACR